MSQVLVVDDQTNVRGSMRLLLERDGHYGRRSGDRRAEALRLAASPAFDVVLTDVRMGGGRDGVTLLHELRTREPRCPGRADHRVRHDRRCVGADRRPAPTTTSRNRLIPIAC